MDNVITLIVIIIMVVSIVNKLKPKDKAKQGKKPVRGGGLIDKLNAFLAEVQNNLEQQNKRTSGESFDWDDLIEEEQVSEQKVRYESESLRNLVLEETPPPAPPPRTPSRMPPRESRLARPKRESPAATDLKPAPGSRRRRHRRSITMHPGQLRKAIVWSEIIGPPVALKGQQGDRL